MQTLVHFSLFFSFHSAQFTTQWPGFTIAIIVSPEGMMHLTPTELLLYYTDIICLYIKDTVIIETMLVCMYIFLHNRVFFTFL